MAINVVVFPQPLGPNRVTNSLSPTSMLMLSSTAVSPNAFDTPSRRISGMTYSPDEACRPHDDQPDNHQLENCHRRNLTGLAFLPGLEHGDTHHLGAWLLQEHQWVVVTQERDEHQGHRREHGRSHDWQRDLSSDRPPACAGRPCRLIELIAHFGHTRVEDDIGDSDV